MGGMYYAHGRAENACNIEVGTYEVKRAPDRVIPK